MIVVTLARKPLTGTVAGNSLKWGCGGVNIDQSRIGAGTVKQATAGNRTIKWGISEGGCSYEKGTGAVFTTEGRWPTNLILVHLSGCVCTGTKAIKASAPTPSGIDRINANMQMQGARPNAYQKGTPPPPADRRNPDGTETVPVWICEDGCPVKGLDDQAGERPGMSGGGATDNRKSGREVVPSFNRKPSAPFIRGDTGGASRFFKQVRS